MLIDLSIIFLATLINALFAMIEISLVASRKSKLEAEAKEGSSRAKAVLGLLDDPTKFLSAVQVGITLVGIFAGAYGGVSIAVKLHPFFQALPLIGAYYEEVAFFLVVLSITYLTIVVGELVPKSIALRYPEKLAKLLAPFMQAFQVICGPVLWSLNRSTDFFCRFLPDGGVTSSSLTEDEIRLVVAQGSKIGVIEETESSIVSKVFRLGDRPASAVMTPRHEVVWIDLDRPLKEQWETLVSSAHSYFPVARESIENVKGIVSIKVVSQLLLSEQGSLEDHLIEPLIVPSQTSALRILEQLKLNRKSFAFVVDEYGGFDGLITLHDLLEALVGELREEEAEETVCLQKEDGSYIVDAAMDVRDLFEKLHLEPEEELQHKGYHSLGGFVMRCLGHIPTENERFEISGFSFIVLDMDKHRVDKVQVIPPAKNTTVNEEAL